jgi:hypothetical protein
MKATLQLYIPLTLAARLQEIAQRSNVSVNKLATEALTIFAEGNLSSDKVCVAPPQMSAIEMLNGRVLAVFKPGELVTFSPELGAEATFYRWKKWAQGKRVLTKSGRLEFSAGTLQEDTKLDKP